MRMADDLDLFKTPRFKYLNMKKDFLEKFMDKRAWGEFGSKEQAVAISGLLGYLKETRGLADQFPHLASDIELGNKKLVLEHILPFPPKLYEQLLLAVVQGEHQPAWKQSSSLILARVEEFLVKMKSACLAAYEDKYWSEVHNFEKYTSDHHTNEDFVADKPEFENKTCDKVTQVNRAQLRRLRNSVYSRIYSKQNAYWQMKKYRAATIEFISNSEDNLSVEDIAVLEDRVELTAKAVKISRLEYKRYLQDQNHKPQIFKSRNRSMSVSEDSDFGHDTIRADENIEPEPKVFDDVYAKSSSKSSDNKEVKLLILPEVPDEYIETSVDVSGDELDKDIMRRLTRLKFFSQTWGLNREKDTPYLVASPADKRSDSEKAISAAMSDDTIEKPSSFLTSSTDDLQDAWTSPITESADLTIHITRLAKYMPRAPMWEDQDLNTAYIRESLDKIWAEYCDTSYITMVNDYVSETLSQSSDSNVSSTSEVVLNTKEQELNSENIKISEFTKLQQDELLATLYTYHSYLVGLVIVSNYVSSHLARSVSFLNNIHKASASPSISTISSQPPETMESAPDKPKDKGTLSRLWENWKSINPISDGKKVGDINEKLTSMAIEAKEETDAVF